jgi:hypothetical protein
MSQKPEDMIVEVIIKKKMTIEECKKLKKNIEKKGFKVQAYEVGFFSEGTKKKVKL